MDRHTVQRCRMVSLQIVFEIVISSSNRDFNTRALQSLTHWDNGMAWAAGAFRNRWNNVKDSHEGVFKLACDPIYLTPLCEDVGGPGTTPADRSRRSLENIEKTSDPFYVQTRRIKQCFICQNARHLFAKLGQQPFFKWQCKTHLRSREKVGRQQIDQDVSEQRCW